jgi:hypothetical protein
MPMTSSIKIDPDMAVESTEFRQGPSSPALESLRNMPESVILASLRRLVKPTDVSSLDSNDYNHPQSPGLSSMREVPDDVLLASFRWMASQSMRDGEVPLSPAMSSLKDIPLSVILASRRIIQEHYGSFAAKTDESLSSNGLSEKSERQLTNTNRDRALAANQRKDRKSSTKRASIDTKQTGHGSHSSNGEKIVEVGSLEMPRPVLQPKSSMDPSQKSQSFEIAQRRSRDELRVSDRLDMDDANAQKLDGINEAVVVDMEAAAAPEDIARAERRDARRRARELKKLEVQKRHNFIVRNDYRAIKVFIVVVVLIALTLGTLSATNFVNLSPPTSSK